MGVKVGEGGKLYGSINNQDIAEALGRRGISVDKHKIDLEQPIKSLGTYKVAIKVLRGHDARGHDRRRAQGLSGTRVPRPAPIGTAGPGRLMTVAWRRTAFRSSTWPDRAMAHVRASALTGREIRA